MHFFILALACPFDLRFIKQAQSPIWKHNLESPRDGYAKGFFRRMGVTRDRDSLAKREADPGSKSRILAAGITAQMGVGKLLGEIVESADVAPEIETQEVPLAALMRYEPNEREAFLAEAKRLLDIVRRYEAKIMRRYEATIPKRFKNAETGEYEFAPTVLRLCAEAVSSNARVLSIEPHRRDCPSRRYFE